MKGYPKSQFEVINNTSINEIDTAVVGPTTALIMAAYTSDKGSEDWELLYGLDNFTTTKGGLNFVKHGQSQLLVANALTNGAYVLGKRMVSDDAKLANATVRARVIRTNGVSYLYTYTSSTSVATFADACKAGYADFDASNAETEVDNGGAKYVSVDVPLFTVTAVGRGASSIYFRMNPEYYASKSNNYTKYAFQVIENTDVIESVICAMNCDAVLDRVSQSIQSKVNSVSKQVKVKVYEDGFLALVKALAQTATLNSKSLQLNELVNQDFINGFSKKGDVALGGIITAATKETDESNWTSLMPEDIADYQVSLDDSIGIPLIGGTYGTMGIAPVSNTVEYEKLLLGTFGKNTESSCFSPVIYDVDAYKVDAIFDCAYPMPVKNAIVDLVDFRGDCVFLADLGTDKVTLNDIIADADAITKSKYVAVYHNFFNIIDPYSKKEITVTMPYNLVPNLIQHVANGVGRPFAGIANGVKFSNIIEGTVNFLPVVIPGNDQKQKLVDNNINYISYYDGVPVMETMYTNDDEYTQLSFLHNVMAVQEIIKLIRTNCPRTRYTFLDGDDLESYIEDAKAIIKQFSTNFKSIDMVYMADEKYEQNNIFYATIKVQFKNFVQEEYFKVIAIN